MNKKPTNTLPQQKEESNAELKMSALYIAMAVRNAMEDFHGHHLSDKQMKELNPLIRDAVYNALYAHAHFETSSKARRFVQYHTEMIPSYWELPQLYESLKNLESNEASDD